VETASYVMMMTYDAAQYKIFALRSKADINVSLIYRTEPETEKITTK